MTNKKLNKMIKDDFEHRYDKVPSAKDIVSKLDLSSKPNAYYEDIDEEKIPKLPMKKSLKYSLFSGAIAILLFVCILTTSLITEKIVLKNIEKNNNEELSEVEETFFLDNSLFVDTSPYYSFTYNLTYDFMIYHGTTKKGTVYFYKLIRYSELIDDITIYANDVTINIDDDKPYGILYEFNDDNIELDIYITIGNVTKHYYIDE